MACEHCRSDDGELLYPHYGVGPHRCFYKIPGAIVGQSEPLQPGQWPENYREDPDVPGMGIWWCGACGEGKPTSESKNLEALATLR